MPVQLRGVQTASFKPSPRYFRVALEEKPSDPSTLSNYGNWLKQQGRTAEAEQAYRASISSDPNFASAHGNLGVLLKERGQTDEAEHEYREALRLNDHDVVSLFNLAFLLWDTRQAKEEAASLVERAASLSQDAFTLGRQALFTEHALADSDIAEGLYQAALKLAPRDPWINARYGTLLEFRGEIAGARRHFEVASAAEEPDLDGLIRDATLYLQDHHLAAAKVLVRRAIRKYPSSEQARALLAQIRRETDEMGADG